MADADRNERRREHARRKRVDPQHEQELTPGRASNTQHMEVADDGAFDLPKRLDEGRRQLATLEAAHHAGDAHAVSGAAWMLRATLGSARTLLDSAARSDVERYRAAFDALSPQPSRYCAVQPTLAAARGVAGNGGALPFLATIQRSFGRHDVSGIRAHAGGAAAAANHEVPASPRSRSTNRSRSVRSRSATTRAARTSRRSRRRSSSTPCSPRSMTRCSRTTRAASAFRTYAAR